MGNTCKPCCDAYIAQRPMLYHERVNARVVRKQRNSHSHRRSHKQPGQSNKRLVYEVQVPERPWETVRYQVNQGKQVTFRQSGAFCDLRPLEPPNWEEKAFEGSLADSTSERGTAKKDCRECNMAEMVNTFYRQSGKPCYDACCPDLTAQKNKASKPRRRSTECSVDNCSQRSCQSACSECCPERGASMAFARKFSSAKHCTDSQCQDLHHDPDCSDCVSFNGPCGFNTGQARAIGGGNSEITFKEIIKVLEEEGKAEPAKAADFSDLNRESDRVDRRTQPAAARPRASSRLQDELEVDGVPSQRHRSDSLDEKADMGAHQAQGGPQPGNLLAMSADI